ncbi:MAG: lysylphosphatidylglycerol synthase transmembrane domain-containing protein [Candidatus Neomarinimicrobiota bacterium]
MRKKFLNWKVLAGILLSAAGLYIGFRKFDGAAFMASLRQTNLWLFLLAMALMVFTVFLRAWRWKYLIMPLKKIPMKHLFASEMICYFGNNVFPLRFGELLRCYALNQSTGLSSVSIFGTVVVERIIDVITFFVIMLITIFVFPGLPEMIRHGGIIAVFIILLVGILVYILEMKKTTIRKFVNQWTNKSKHGMKILDIFNRFRQGLTTLRKTPHLGMIALQSATIWSICIFINWIVGVSLDTQFSLYEVLLIFFVTSAIISVPSAPGYVGTYHAGAIGILVFLGVELSKAQAIAVILHAVGFISLTSIGLLYFLRYSVRANGSEFEKG